MCSRGERERTEFGREWWARTKNTARERSASLSRTPTKRGSTSACGQNRGVWVESLKAEGANGTQSTVDSACPPPANAAPSSTSPLHSVLENCLNGNVNGFTTENASVDMHPMMPATALCALCLQRYSRKR